MKYSYRRGALIVRRLCVLLGAEKVYLEFSTILENEVDLDFASLMVQVDVQHFLYCQNVNM
jgi:vacuole morphology and inheritance protein 14